MNEKSLSKRLQLVASYLPEYSFFADIGSDHAYLPCYVCINNKGARAIAGEINEGPFQSAVRTVEEHNLASQVEVRKGDGLLVLEENEVSQVVIAGMGGSLIADILEKGKAKLGNVKRIIAQPNVDASAVRKWFLQNGFHLVNEEIISEAGHIYEILVADVDTTSSAYSNDQLEKELLFGPFLLQKRSNVFKQKWEIEKQKRQRALLEMQKAKIPNNEKIVQFETEIRVIEEVIQSE